MKEILPPIPQGNTRTAIRRTDSNPSNRPVLPEAILLSQQLGDLGFINEAEQDIAITSAKAAVLPGKKMLSILFVRWDNAEAYTVLMCGGTNTIGRCGVVATLWPVFNFAVKFLFFFLTGGKYWRTSGDNKQTHGQDSKGSARDISFIVAVRSVAVCLMSHLSLS